MWKVGITSVCDGEGKIEEWEVRVESEKLTQRAVPEATVSIYDYISARGRDWLARNKGVSKYRDGLYDRGFELDADTEAIAKSVIDGGISEPLLDRLMEIGFLG
jgi:hypothetical protein